MRPAGEFGKVSLERISRRRNCGLVMKGEERVFLVAKAVKLADIAGKMNVSIVTVSKALSGQKGVSEEVREKIKKLADEMGYKQPSAGKAGGKKKGYSIGVLVGDRYLDKYDSFYWNLYQEVAQKALAEGCIATLEALTAQTEKNRILPTLLRENKVDGVIVLGILEEEYLALLRKNVKAPMVYLDFFAKSHECDAVVTDNYFGMYRLTSYLFEMGHTEIAYVGNLLATESITDRYFGYAKALMEHGVQIREDWILDDRDRVTGRSDAGFELKMPQQMPTAFACNCDYAAGQVIRKLEGLGYRVPDDFSVVGYDNYIYPGLCDVDITTYEVDMKGMAAMSVSTLLSRIAGEKAGQKVVTVEGRMVLKDSVAKRNGTCPEEAGPEE